MHCAPLGSVYYLHVGVCVVTCQFCFPPDFHSSLIKSKAWEARRVVLRLSYRQLPLHPRTEEQNQQLLIKSLLNEPHFWLKYSLEVTEATPTQTRCTVHIQRDEGGWSWRGSRARTCMARKSPGRWRGDIWSAPTWNHLGGKDISDDQIQLFPQHCQGNQTMSPSATATCLLNPYRNGVSITGLGHFSELVFLYIQPKCPLVELEAISSSPIACYLGEEAKPHLVPPSCQGAVE